MAFLILALNSTVLAQEHILLDSPPHRFEISTPSFVISGIEFSLEVTARTADGAIDTSYHGRPEFENVFFVEGHRWQPIHRNFEAGRLLIPNAVVAFKGSESIVVRDGGVFAAAHVRAIPGILSILPPLLAIALALIFRQVVIALFAGVWVGAFIMFGFDPLVSLLRVLDHFIIDAISTPSHVKIIVFSMLFGGMVGVIARNGGTLGIANLVTRFSKNDRRGQISTWFLSFLFFFDDYANVLIRGNLMRPITDKLRISREKLAYIVDAGAATVASVFIVSSWIGYEVGLIEQSLKSIGWQEDAYAVFIQTIPYRFYPILTLAFVLFVGLSRRDFGPMYAAEVRARRAGKVLRDGAQPATDLTDSAIDVPDDLPRRWVNGLLPIVAVIVVALTGLYITGVNALIAEGVDEYRLGDVIGKADSYAALLWASFVGCLVAIILSVSQRILTATQAIEAWFNGLKSMLLAMLILVLAWSIGAVTEELKTAAYLVQILKGTLAPQWLPVLTFAVAAVISFSTGTSWGTMAILMPLVVPLSYSVSVDAGLAVGNVEVLLYGTISSVLAGAVFGDHCSPISDTTILSSMASACDHIDHVRTQLPYALLVAIVGMVIGDVGTAYGLSPYLALIIGFAVLVVLLTVIGKRLPQ